MASADEIRAKLLAMKNNKGGRKDGQTQSGGDNASYPFWNIPEDSSVSVRFLPDGDPENTFFWVNREVIRLDFAGVVGGEYPTDKPVTVTVPCVDMFGMTCPIIAATRPWWKDPAKESLARKYWKKKSYIFQGFVSNSPLNEENVPENPIRRFVINPSLYEIIEKALINPEMEDLPTDFTAGRDFKIAKTRKGEYANYSTSSWSFKTRSLTETEQAAIAQFGLFDLKQYQGRKPDADELDAIKAMFEASVDGEPYDMESFGKWFRPYGSRDGGGDDTMRAVAARQPTSESFANHPMGQAFKLAEQEAKAQEALKTLNAPAASTQTAPASAGGKPNPAEILERIRQRTGK